MNTWTYQRRSARGFTLVELLVVIAIIGILAGIVVPQVAQYIRRSKVARAQSEIRNADSSLAAMLADAKRSSFRHFLDADGRQYLANIPVDGTGFPATIQGYLVAQSFYNQMFYELLRRGKNVFDSPQPWIAQFLEPEAIDKLSAGYMDLATDPWGHPYFFWMGPYAGNSLTMHRSYRGEGYVYNQAEYNALQAKVPGNPGWDDLAGFPAPRNAPVYIYSGGPNEIIDATIRANQQYAQSPDFYGGGDDINNWDSEAGWEEAPQT